MRSDPLILKDGEPKYPMPSQLSNAPWRLVVTDEEGRNRGKKFHSYRQAKEAVAKLRGEHPDFEYTIVSRQISYGPPRSKITDKQLQEMNDISNYWCPYCRKFREFEWDPYALPAMGTTSMGTDRCPVCRIRIDDSTVVKNNPTLAYRMWGGDNVT